ncbi:MAG: glycosyltransferase family 9 protein [Candidatus Eremiobacteraeota bacterium]|nr:glycosyltransferase family 9 protein [Candidatus Eremiobacteraeota bacterium]
MPKVSPPVLIIRLDGIGDALALTPLLAVLRRHAITVDAVLRRSNAGVFSSRAARRIVTADFQLRSSTRSNRDAIEGLGRQLRAQEYSHVLVATEDPGGYRLARAVGAPVRIGFANAWGKPFKTLWSRSFLTKTVYRSAGLDRRAPHESAVLFRLAGALLGDEAPVREPAELRPLVLEREPVPDDRVAVQITDKWERLGVSHQDVVELIRRLAAAGDLHLLAAPEERAYAERICSATGLAVRYFDDIAGWKAAIGAAPAIVTPDSGALHVAGMIGTPVVAIFPPSRRYALQVARWAPWAAPHRIVRADRDWPARASEALAQLL